jgi:c-di-GMP-binding flagellar brake protein YcgR
MGDRVVCITNAFHKGEDRLITLEKRRAPRVDLKLECNVNFSSQIKARSVNISETGICLFADEDLGDNQFITLMVNLRQDEMVKFICKVIWIMQLQPSLYQYGLEFWDIESRKVTLFKDYIQQYTGR